MDLIGQVWLTAHALLHSLGCYVCTSGPSWVWLAAHVLLHTLDWDWWELARILR
jgi:hypothetical protein